jgi:hypothetical protein
MTQHIVLKSLEELGRFADLVLPDDEPSNERALVPVVPALDIETELAALAESAVNAAGQLRELAEADVRARHEAEETLERHRRLQEQARRLAGAETEACQLSEQASQLAKRAFTPELREKAGHLAITMAKVAASAASHLASIEADAASLSQREDLAWLLAEEQAHQEAARREDEQRQRQERLREQIDEADELANQGKGNEALRLLGQLATDEPNEPTLASYLENVRRRAWAVKTVEVEKALREARRRYRREPRQSLALLEPLDLTDMPETLTRQVYGCWLATCRRLNVGRGTHYSPAIGKGAVLVPADDGRLEVVTAIGLPRWQAGSRFSTSALKGARSLR